MAKSEFELKVVDSGVWQLDLAQPRIPATERAGFASTEAYLRGFEGKGIWGLSGLEVSYRGGSQPWHLQVQSQAVRARVSGHASGYS